MKLIFVIIFFSFSSTSLLAQTKRALIVAIGKYLHWEEISSVNDVDYIKAALAKHGFERQNIKTITDQAATHTGITTAIKSLIADAKKGDIAVIHFSSHGEQIEDDNGDETDGLDETIVTYNAIPPDDNGHFQDYQKAQMEYLRDDEFGSLVDDLRKKLGKDGDVVVFMDLCHSGSGTRGYAKVRGNKIPGVSSTFDPTKYSRHDTAVFREEGVVRGDQNNLSTYVVFSAARAEELATEIATDDGNTGSRMGPLSYALSKQFATLDMGTTYRSLFAKIQAVLDEKVPGQHAVLEGDGIDRQLFGGKFIHQKPYIEIEAINGQRMKIKAGLLSGLDTGATVAVYPSGTTEPGKSTPLASGRVIRSGSFTADVKLDKDPLLSQISSGWVFVTGTVYNTKAIGVGIISKKDEQQHRGFSESEIEAIQKNLKDFRLINFDSGTDLIIAKGQGVDSIIVASNGYLFATVSDIASGTDELKETFERYAQSKFLKSLPEINDPNIKIEVQLVPVINGKADTTKINTKLVTGAYEYAVGDKMVVWVKNNGTVPFYFNILDIQPDGVINAVLPKKSEGITADDLRVNAQSTFLFDKYIITLTPPVGQEIFKIFASEQKINLEDIATTRGASTRGNLSFLESLVKNSYSLATRGAGDVENISGANGKVFNLLFRINPKR